MVRHGDLDIPDTHILGGHLGFPGVFQSNFDFQLGRVMGTQTYGGAELGECLVTARRIPDGDLEAWRREWSALADRVEVLALHSLEKGHVVSAREAFLRSSSYYKVAMFFLAHRDPEKKVLWELSRGSFQQAGRLFDPPFEPVEIPFESITLPGYFLRPAGRTGARPTVLIQGGGDTTAEELFFFGGGAGAIRRGFNALLFDGPGQVGAAQLYPEAPYRPDWEKPVGAVVDYALSRRDVDPDRLALVGYSFGGLLAPRAAAFEKRLRACAAFPIVPERGSPLQIFGLDPSQQIPDGIEATLEMTPLRHLLLHDWCARMGGVRPTVAEFARVRHQFTLWGVEDKLTCALLCVCTSGEGQVTVANARAWFDAAASQNKKFVLLTEEDGADAHCVVNNLSRSQQELFDWLAVALDVRQ